MRNILVSIFTVVASILGIMSAPNATQAAPILAGYPAPGGTSFASNGVNPYQGTATWTYTLLDTTAYDQLWWGFEDMRFAMDGDNTDDAGETLSLSSMAGGTAVWTGTTSVLAGTVYTRATATIVSGMPGGWITPGSVGIVSPGIFAVGEATGNSFVVDFKVEASFTDGSGYQAWLPFFDANTGQSEDGNSRTDFTRNFYYTETAVIPVPATLPLLLAGLAALGLAAHRRRKA